MHFVISLGDKPYHIHSIATQGRPNFKDNGGWFVHSFSVETSVDGRQWLPYKEFGILKVFCFMWLATYSFCIALV